MGAAGRWRSHFETLTGYRITLFRGDDIVGEVARDLRRHLVVIL